MRVVIRAAVAAALALAVQGGSAQAQYGRYAYPRGYGDWGWNGWGAGGGTVQGDVARGLGAFAAGAGAYNEQTAAARSVNADTVMRWNEYWYQSQQQANRRYRERMAQKQYGTTQAQDKIYRRLRDTPAPRDIESGDALNVALDEINDPRVYARSLRAAKVAVGGETVRDIPFQYAAAAISTSVHQVTQGGPPPSLKTPAFDADRARLKPLGAEIRKQIEDGGKPDPATVDRALAAVAALEAKVDQTYPRNSRERVEADKYLKALRGLLRMLETPAIDVLLAGVEKRPETTLGELLTFMNSFNLRFGPATSARQRAAYEKLYPMLIAVRSEVAPALAGAGELKTGGDEAPAFFSGMNREDLEKKAPPPPPAPGEPSK